MIVNFVLYIIILIELVSFLYFIRRIFGLGFSIIKLFNSAWLICILFYLINPYDYYSIGVSVCFYIFLLLLVVNITFIVTKKGKCINIINKEQLSSDAHTYDMSILLLVILSISCWIISIKYLTISLGIIASKGFSALRGSVYFEDIFDTQMRLIYQYFVQPIFLIVINLMIIMFVILRKKLYLIPVAVINALVYSLLFGGRSILVTIVCNLGFVLLIQNGGRIRKIIEKQRKILLFAIFVAIAVAMYSSLRVTRQWGIIGEMSIYLFAGPSYLTQLLSHNDSILGISYGQETFGCFVNLVQLFMRFLGINTSTASQIYSQYAQQYESIGEGIRTNYTSTTLLTFLMDFGVFGIIIGGIVLGLFFSATENMYTKKGSLYSLIIYMYAVNASFFTIQDYPLKSVGVISFFVLSYFFFKHRFRYRLVVHRKRKL